SSVPNWAQLGLPNTSSTLPKLISKCLIVSSLALPCAPVRLQWLRTWVSRTVSSLAQPFSCPMLPGDFRCATTRWWAVPWQFFSLGGPHGQEVVRCNLTYGVTDSALEQMFAPYGTVESAQVIMDRDTGRSKGFGFVEMKTDQEAQAAIAAMNG